MRARACVCISHTPPIIFLGIRSYFLFILHIGSIDSLTSHLTPHLYLSSNTLILMRIEDCLPICTNTHTYRHKIGVPPYTLLSTLSFVCVSVCLCACHVLYL